MNLEGSIRIIAAVIRGEQDMYLNHDIDISHSPGILVTIFNLGQGHLRAKKSSEEGRDPQHNYMGLFVLKHLDKIQKLLYKD